MASGGGTSNDRVHYNTVGLHQVVPYLCRTGVHEESRDQDKQCTANEQTHILVGELSGCGCFVNLENLEDLAVREVVHVGILCLELLDVVTSYLLDNFPLVIFIL